MISFFRNMADDFKHKKSIKPRKQHLARVLSRFTDSTKDSNEILKDTSTQYTKYFIKKSDGGKRLILKPSLELRRMQLMTFNLVKMPSVSRFCAGFECKTSILKNAQAHKTSKHILHMDIKNFFPSINFKMFQNAYRFLDNDTIRNVWNIVSYENALPIGSPASPFIANRIMYEIDIKLSQIDNSLVFTRYADDLTFSSKKPIEMEIVAKVKAVLAQYGFEANERKTYFMGNRRTVTGLIITKENKISVGTTYKKQLKDSLYKLLCKNEGNIKSVRGKFAFLTQIEPEYAKKLKEKYLQFDTNKILATF